MHTSGVVGAPPRSGNIFIVKRVIITNFSKRYVEMIARISLDMCHFEFSA
jgi:hypothetical protein